MTMTENPEIPEDPAAVEIPDPSDVWSEGPPVKLNLQEELGLAGQIEALIFAAPKPLKAQEIVEYLSTEGNESRLRDVHTEIAALISYYGSRGGGFILVESPPKCYSFRTVESASPLMERMFSKRPRPLSRAAQETLAIIAYRQPCTRADIEFIRGVDAGSIMKNLLELELIRCTGRKEAPGKPLQFGTTEDFLRVYGLSGLEDLPPLAAFQPAQETIKEALKKLASQNSLDLTEAMVDSAQIPEKPRQPQRAQLELDNL